MKYQELIIYGCPQCKKYLNKNDYYRYCMYCGKTYNKNKLIILDTVKIKKESWEK